MDSPNGVVKLQFQEGGVRATGVLRASQALIETGKRASGRPRDLFGMFIGTRGMHLVKSPEYTQI